MWEIFIYGICVEETLSRFLELSQLWDLRRCRNQTRSYDSTILDHFKCVLVPFRQKKMTSAAGV